MAQWLTKQMTDMLILIEGLIDETGHNNAGLWNVLSRSQLFHYWDM
jgi:hypothetical protein